MTMAELETAVREKAQGDRGRLRQRALRHDPDVAGPARRARTGVATDLGPVDFAAIARACGGARGPGRDRRRLRAGAPAGAGQRPDDGHPARARPGLGPPGPAVRRRARDPARVTPTYHLTPAEWWAAADPAAPLGSPSLDDEGFIHCTDGADELVATANRHYRDDRRPFVRLTHRPGPGRRSVAGRGREPDLPARLRTDRPRFDPRGPADPARRRRDVPADPGLTRRPRGGSAVTSGRAIVSA